MEVEGQRLLTSRMPRRSPPVSLLADLMPTLVAHLAWVVLKHCFLVGAYVRQPPHVDRTSCHRLLVCSSGSHS
jgi:hypothetical protein